VRDSCFRPRRKIGFRDPLVRVPGFKGSKHALPDRSIEKPVAITERDPYVQPRRRVSPVNDHGLIEVRYLRQSKRESELGGQRRNSFSRDFGGPRGLRSSLTERD
jgi:hypothetical protein